MNVYLSPHRHQVLLALFTLGMVAWGGSRVARFRHDSVARFRGALIDQIGSARPDQAGVCEPTVFAAHHLKGTFF
jgi:hypothetical protein